jgi:hypothetical protein
MLVMAAMAAVLGLGAMVFIQPTEAASTTTSSALTHGGRGFCGQAGLEAAAEVLGMTADELTTQLWGGQTLSGLAEKAGVDLQDVQDAVNAACQTATRDAIEQAVTDGTISREKADWLLEGLDKGYWGGSNGGFGFGPRGFGGRGHFGQSPFNNTVPPTTTSGSDS